VECNDYFAIPAGNAHELANTAASLKKLRAFILESMEQTEPEEPMSPEQPEENIHLICPNCDARMLDRGCKLVCQRCGYFMGCSDYV
jgi:hypothetical protein